MSGTVVRGSRSREIRLESTDLVLTGRLFWLGCLTSGIFRPGAYGYVNLILTHALDFPVYFIPDLIHRTVWFRSILLLNISPCFCGTFFPSHLYRLSSSGKSRTQTLQSDKERRTRTYIWVADTVGRLC